MNFNSRKLLLLSASLLVANSLCSAAIVFDGTITEPEWGSALATSSGGPTPGFGSGHEINAAYAAGDANNIFLAIAGNVQFGNRILLFIDSKSGGYNTGNFGRGGTPSAPQGLDDFNSGVTFDSGFNADFALVIGTNNTHDDFFFDLYTLSGTAGSGGGPNTFLGASSSTSSLGASPANSSNTQGFEMSLSKTSLGYTGGDIQIFGAYISDAGFLSNQFLTRADSGQGNFGGGAVNFTGEPPNPITVPASVIPEASSLLLLLGGAGLALFRRRR